MRYLQGQAHHLPGNRATLAGYRASHFLFGAGDGVATLTLNRPDRKNPLTFDSYAELRDLFLALARADDIKAVVITGAGAMLALASDVRIGTERSKTAFLFTRVGLAGCDMGACALLPRVIGQGRAGHRTPGVQQFGAEAERWGFFNSLRAPEELAGAARAFAQALADGPTFAHGMTKNMLQQEWNMGVDQAIEAEAQAQAICMATNDFHRAYHAFVAKQKPEFEGD